MKKCLFILSPILLIIICIQIATIVINKKQYNKLEELIVSNNIKEQYLTDIIELNNTLNNIINNQEFIVQKIDSNLERINEVDNNINQIYPLISKTDRNIQKVNSTYSVLLEEQKKKTIDITKTDNAMATLRTQAKDLYANKKYYECYLSCKQILTFETDDTDTRELLVKALYKANPADSLKYAEIINNISIISRNKIVPQELVDIETAIKLEKGIENE